MRHTARALVVGEVAVTLEEAIDDIEGCGDNEVVVVGKGNGVDEGGEERVEGAFWFLFFSWLMDRDNRGLASHAFSS